MVVHSRAHKLSEGIICPLPHPAVNDHALRPKANGLALKITVLEECRLEVRKCQKQILTLTAAVLRGPLSESEHKTQSLACSPLKHPG